MVIHESNRFFEAVESGDIQTLARQLERGDDINSKNANGQTALFIATIYSNVEIIKYLLKQGANPNLVDAEGTSALIEAAGKHGTPNILRMLLDAKANINHSNSIGWTALIAATQAGYVDNMSVLFEYGVDVDFINTNHESAVTYSVVWKRYECLALLIQAGAKIDIADSFGWSPLAYAVRENDLRALKMLLLKGADVNRIDKNGDPLVFNAARWGGIELIKEIVHHPGYIEQVDSSGKTVLDVIREREDAAEIERIM